MSSTRVYIGNLYYDVRERDLDRFFKGYGRIRDVFLKNGYGFVEFEDARDADDAVYELNGKELLGERVTVEHARGPTRGRDRRDDRYGGRYGGGGGSRRPAWLDKYGPPQRTEHRLIVENLSSRASWQDLKDFFRKAGEISFADAHKERMNEGIIEFANREDMKYALDKYDGEEINGRKIRLVEDKPRRRSRGRRSRTRSRSRSRSRSNSRSRSRSRGRKRGSTRDSLSRSPARKKRNSKSKSRSRSKSNEKDGEREKSKSRSRSRSRSASPATQQQEAQKEDRRSRSSDRRDSRSRSRSKSPE